MEQRDHILIADDENEIRSLLRLYLENEGYEVDAAADGEEALKKIAGGDIHLCLLDIMMPKIDGFHVLKTLRETSNIPVIIVSAKGADPEKILGLDLGADDYIVKPFNPLEAVARVRSNLRRWHELNRRPDADGNAAGGRGAAAGGVSSSYVNLPGAARQPETLTHRDLTLDLDACCLYRGDQRIDLTSVEFKIMEMFMEYPGKVFTRQQIYERGWGEEYAVADNNIMVCISKLRGKLSDDPAAYIKTIRGLGYRLER